MKAALLAILRRASPWLPLRAMIRWSGQSLAIPFYHIVSDEPCPHVEPIYPVRDSATFRRDLDFFLHHFEPVGLEEILVQYNPHRHKPFSKPRVHLTVDDGLRQGAEIMAPILLEKGMPATFFLNSAFVDNRDLMFRYKAALLADRWQKVSSSAKRRAGKRLAAAGIPANGQGFLQVKYADRDILDRIALLFDLDFEVFLHNYQPYMTSGQVRGLLEQGFQIGAHSIDHPWYEDLNEPERQRQTLDSSGWIQKEFSLESFPPFAFPFADAGLPESHFNMIFDAGIPLSFGGSGLKRDIFGNLPRFPMEKSRASAHSQVHSEYAWYLLKSSMGRHRMLRPPSTG